MLGREIYYVDVDGTEYVVYCTFVPGYPGTREEPEEPAHYDIDRIYVDGNEVIANDWLLDRILEQLVQ